LFSVLESGSGAGEQKKQGFARVGVDLNKYQTFKISVIQVSVKSDSGGGGKKQGFCFSISGWAKKTRFLISGIDRWSKS
jgi:hypothetical protein